MTEAHFNNSKSEHATKLAENSAENSAGYANLEPLLRNAAQQSYPKATLYLVATPIGNRSDISLRALYVLGMVDAVFCEDTRHTQTLLAGYGIRQTLCAAHEHNELEAAQALLQRLEKGERVAYVSDAGMPAVSDPGARLVAAAQAAGFGVTVLPGASAVLSALALAGVAPSHDAAGQGFCFAGFLPAKAAVRTALLLRLAQETRPVVWFEAPHRVLDTAAALADTQLNLGQRLVTVCRELTKQFEQVTTLPAHALHAWFSADPQRQRGEFVWVLHPAPADSEAKSSEKTEALTLHTRLDTVLCTLLAELPLKTAVKVAVQLTGLNKNLVYEKALSLRTEADEQTQHEHFQPNY